MAPRWIVLREGARLRWGGDLRRHHILSALASRGDALDVDGWSPAKARDALAGAARWPWSPKPRVAAATMLAPEALGHLRGRSVPFAVDFHDDPATQTAALGVVADPAWLAQTTERKRRNLEAFRWQIVPSLPLAELAGLDRDRTIVAGNGSDTSVIRPMPWPTEPAVALMSGAAPGRGIEALVEAARIVRATVSELRLLLWLAPTGAASEAYLADLRRSTSAETWIEYGARPYAEIAIALGRATIQCVPNPPATYWDAVSPIKLFDAMASGRPVVVTPRAAMRADVERHEAGLVAAGDRPEDLAGPILRLLEDQALARLLGANGRQAAVTEHDWAAISARLAANLVELAG